MKIAILDDYLRLSQTVADWSKLAPTCDITAFLQGKPIRILSAERNTSLHAG